MSYIGCVVECDWMISLCRLDLWHLFPDCERARDFLMRVPGRWCGLCAAPIRMLPAGMPGGDVLVARAEGLGQVAGLLDEREIARYPGR
jgi:hypothetical protein